MNAIRQNVQYLKELTRGSRWPMLRRNPPVFTVESTPWTACARCSSGT